MLLNNVLATALVGATSVLGASLQPRAGLQQVSNFGTNPTGVQMYVYVPAKVATKPAILLGLHPCGGSASEWYSGSGKVPSYADQYGWILIYAQTTRYSNCWDVNNPATLTHNGGGDAQGLVSMVNYALKTYNGDASKVFVYGASSGAMMTNVMAGSYPDVFNAGAAYSGTADACFLGSTSDPTPSGSNQTCAQGQINRSAQSWGDLARNSYPGYSGNHTRMQIWHGLADTLVRPACGYQALEQWGNVFGLTNQKNVSGTPSSAYTQVNYGDGSQVVGYFGQGVGHFAPMQEVPMLKFFGLITG